MTSDKKSQSVEKKKKKKTETKKKEKKSKHSKEHMKAVKAALKKDKKLKEDPHRFKTIDDILKEEASALNMKGDEILSQEQMKILLTQMALGNVKDGFGLSPSIQERQKAIEMLSDMTKADISEDAIDEHNESIKEFEMRNGFGIDDDEVPSRSLEEFE